MYFSEKSTLPNIDWNNEDRVSSLTAHKLRLYLKLHYLQAGAHHPVTGQWRESNASSSCFSHVRDAQQILKPEDNDVTSDSELQYSNSEDPDNSELDAQKGSSEMGDFIEHSYQVFFVPDTDCEYVTVQSK